MNTKIIIILFAITSILTSCAVLKDSDFSKIAIGMTKAEFLNMNLEPRIIGSKKYNDGLLEIYERVDFNFRAIEDQRHYWFYFYNNSLEEWGPKENFVPNEYDKYYKEYLKRRNNQKEQD